MLISLDFAQVVSDKLVYPCTAMVAEDTTVTISSSMLFGTVVKTTSAPSVSIWRAYHIIVTLAKAEHTLSKSSDKLALPKGMGANIAFQPKAW
jgi:hypothetical protein